MRVTVEDGKSRVTIDGGTVARAQHLESWDGTGIAAKLVKAAPERRFTLHVAYPANKPDTSVAADGYRDFASPEALEDAAWAYLRKGGQIGLWHQDSTENAGTCVESYIYRGPDWHITAHNGTEHVIKAGDWMVGIQWNEDTWPLVLAGKIGGVSMQGRADRRRPSREALAMLRS